MLDPQAVRDAVAHPLRATDFEGMGDVIHGKVRDLYLQPGRRLLVASDRLSAFDRIITCVPWKGQVLNEISAWWFEQTADVVANHVLAIPDPNVTVGVEAQTIPIEVVVRGYITGVTDTALWSLYSDGVDKPYGLTLPVGLKKNDKLPEFVITPTTKGGVGEHDERLSEAELLRRGLVSPERWEEVRTAALEIFRRGTEVAARAGLILVDTKYEFGVVDDKLVLIDEVHTPDSSRYWDLEAYGPAHAAGQPQSELSKEHMRRWLKSVGYGGEGTPPPVPPDVIVELAMRYVNIFERLTGRSFEPAEYPAGPRIEAALRSWQHTNPAAR